MNSALFMFNLDKALAYENNDNRDAIVGVVEQRFL